MPALNSSRWRWARAFAVWGAVIVSAGCGNDSNGGTPTATNHVLRVQGAGAGSGTVTAPDASPPLACSIAVGTAAGMCVSAYPSNSTVRLVAVPNGGSTFAGWSGACTGTGECVVTMSQERTVTASFTLPPVLTFTLTLVMSGQGSGTVSSSPGGIGCTILSGSVSGTCTATFTQGTQVTLTAAAMGGGGSSFGGWGGSCGPSGTSATCTIPMLQDQGATATFRAASAVAR